MNSDTAIDFLDRLDATPFILHVDGEQIVVDAVAPEPSDDPVVVKRRFSVRRRKANGKYSKAQDIIVQARRE